MDSMFRVAIDVFYQKKFNVIINFIKNSVNLDETESLHIYNPSNFEKAWIINSKDFFYEICFVDVGLIEFLMSLNNKEKYDIYSNRMTSAISKADINIRFVGFKINEKNGIKRVIFLFCQR